MRREINGNYAADVPLHADLRHTYIHLKSGSIIRLYEYCCDFRLVPRDLVITQEDNRQLSLFLLLGFNCVVNVE